MPATLGATESVSVGVQGPAALVANVPRDELERSVTVSGGPAVAGVPAAVVNETVEAAEGTPAVTVSLGGAMVRSGCVQVRNERQAPLWLAPSMSTLQRVSAPGGPATEIELMTE